MSSRPGTRPSSATIFIGLVAIVVLVLFGAWVVLNGSAIIRSFFPPDPVTSQAKAIHDLYTIVFIIAAIIFFVTEGLILWTVLRYRRRAGDDELPPQTHGHNAAEIVWTVVPTLIVVFLFFISWQTLNTVEAANPSPDLKVRIHAGQFQWTFEYLPANAGPRDDALFSVTTPQAPDGGLVLPAGKTTHLYLLSNDVIHAFYVPQFLFKRDVVPGHINEFDITVDAGDAGQVFRGQCAELCGIGHDIMLFDVRAMTPADFQKWYAQKLVEAKATPAPPPSGEPAGSGGPTGGGPVLNLTAKDVHFNTDKLSAPANTPFTIHFDNQDAGTPHDVDILDPSGGAKIEDGKDFNGVASRDYPVKPLPAGTYKYECSIHPQLMFGTLTVQ